DASGVRRVLASLKSNLAPPAPALAWTVVAGSNGAPRVEWLGVADGVDVAVLLSAPAEGGDERGALSEAKTVLQSVLEDGPLAVREVRRQARQAGVSDRTLDRAKLALGVFAVREGFGS